jgi:hypothetical protein
VVPNFVGNRFHDSSFIFLESDKSGRQLIGRDAMTQQTVCRQLVLVVYPSNFATSAQRSDSC